MYKYAYMKLIYNLKKYFIIHTNKLGKLYQILLLRRSTKIFNYKRDFTTPSDIIKFITVAWE